MSNEIIKLIESKIVKYESDMEGADYIDFIKAEWAAGAMQQLLIEALKINDEFVEDKLLKISK